MTKQNILGLVKELNQTVELEKENKQGCGNPTCKRTKCIIWENYPAIAQALLIAVDHLEMIQKYCTHPYAKEKTEQALKAISRIKV